MSVQHVTSLLGKTVVMSGFECMECGRKFKTIKAAERAAFGADGCPKCGSSDIDLASTERIVTNVDRWGDTRVVGGHVTVKIEGA